MAGTKRVEFRRRPFRRRLEYVVVYATEPVGKIVGFFEVTEVTPAAPDVLWSEFADVGGVERDQFRAYYAGRDLGYAIQVGDVWKLRRPIPLGQLSPDLTPPQSFVYLATCQLERLQRRAADLCPAN